MKSIKYDYMEHWTIPTPVGYMKPFGRRSYMEKNVKELAARGFSGFQLMAASMATYARMFGGEKGTLVDFEKFIQDCGMDGITGMFWCNLSDRHETSSINPDFHDNILQIARNFAEQAKGTSIDTYIYMPAGCYCYEMPVTDDNVHILADLANKMGKMLLEDYGIRLTCHHEFWCGLRDYDEIIKYYEWT
ncbi:MAG: hypothetical protein Q4D29_13605, partial [Lachnospiraceae bacterium]|nr:hypothetical protein [Lachnospiraceae bacterium]